MQITELVNANRIPTIITILIDENDNSNFVLLNNHDNNYNIQNAQHVNNSVKKRKIKQQ